MRDITNVKTVEVPIKTDLYIKAGIIDKNKQKRTIIDQKSESMLRNWAALLYQAMGFNCRTPQMFARSISWPGWVPRGWGRLHSQKLGLTYNNTSGLHNRGECGLSLGREPGWVRPYWNQAGMHDETGEPHDSFIRHGTDDAHLFYHDHVPIEPVVLSDNAFFTIRRPIENQATADIWAYETGIYFRNRANLYRYPIPSTSTSTLSTGDLDGTFLVVRDWFPPNPTENIVIAQGETLDLDYIFKTAFDTVNGGLTRQFIDLLFRHCCNTSYNVFNLKGNGVDKSPSAYGMLCQSTLGNRIYTDSTDVHHTNDMEITNNRRKEYLGVIVGTDDSDININNYNLGDKIMESDGLHHYDTKVHAYDEAWDVEQITGYVQITGSVENPGLITGTETLFTTELAVGDYVQPGPFGIVRVVEIVSDVEIIINRNYVFYSDPGYPIFLHTGRYDMEASWLIERMFVNKSGASMTIKEAGLTCMGDENNLHLIARNKIAPAITVADGEALRMIYKYMVEDESPDIGL